MLAAERGRAGSCERCQRLRRELHGRLALKQNGGLVRRARLNRHSSGEGGRRSRERSATNRQLRAARSARRRSSVRVAFQVTQLASSPLRQIARLLVLRLATGGEQR